MRVADEGCCSDRTPCLDPHGLGGAWSEGCYVWVTIIGFTADTQLLCHSCLAERAPELQQCGPGAHLESNEGFYQRFQP
jgi:hypothetical protein